MSIFSPSTTPREGMPDPKLDRAAFLDRFRFQFSAPAYDAVRDALDQVAETAWAEYRDGDKSPRTRRAGPGFADPEYELSVDWLAARDAIEAARAVHADAAGPPRILLVNGSPRSEHTCPGEMSKSWRLTEMAREEVERAGGAVEVLDLSRTTSEYGRSIHPCKACFSTAAALCHWPCSCYPNHSLGQAQDWMNEIYPMWVRAHGVMIVAPVHWYQATSPLKAMIDRLVCADGGNPDPSSTHGKDAEQAKRMELAGWSYPRHLAGRSFAVVAHGDVEGAEGVRRAVADWLSFMHLRPAGKRSQLDRYIGYWEPYATSHDALDRDEQVQGEVRNAARALIAQVIAVRAGKMLDPEAGLEDPVAK